MKAHVTKINTSKKQFTEKILEEYKNQDIENNNEYIAYGDCDDWCCIGCCDVCSDISCDCCSGDL